MSGTGGCGCDTTEETASSCCSSRDAAASESCCAPEPAAQAPASACCGGGPKRDSDYTYGPQTFEVGTVDTLMGPVPVIGTELTRADIVGGWKVRWNIGRHDYRVRPGLYAIGAPDDTAPVLVTSNYKLTLDYLRRELGGIDAWLLVLDTNGVNVWCAAGKGLFATDELVRRVREAHLEQVVSHNVLVVPQLGATGVAAHEVRKQSGFRVVFGPVRAADIPAFLEAGMEATPAMRQVEFPTWERAKLTGIELSVLWSSKVLPWAAAVLIAALAAQAFGWLRLGVPALVALAAAALAVIAGAGLTPLVLPLLPGRAFSKKGAIAGAIVLVPTLYVLNGGALTAAAWGLIAAGVALSSFVAMNFTGSSTYTSPSGVEWEMRRAIPAQIAGGVVGILLFLVATVMG